MLLSPSPEIVGVGAETTKTLLPPRPPHRPAIPETGRGISLVNTCGYASEKTVYYLHSPFLPLRGWSSKPVFSREPC